jgi:glycosyltransferase involved in cell wall biosynthesis
MRIVHFIDDAHPVGGAQTYLERFCAGTAVMEGWEHVVLADRAPDKGLLGVRELVLASGNPSQDAAAALAFAPDVALLHTVDSADLAEILARRVHTLAYAHDYRHISPGNLRFFQRTETFCDQGFGARCFVKPYTESCNSRRPDRVLASVRRVWRWRETLTRIAGVLCASQFVASLVSEFAPCARASVVGYPIGIPDVAVGPASERPHILYVGRTSAVKGLNHLLDAFALLAPDRPHTKLLLAAGPDLDAVRRECGARGIDSGVQLLGWLRGEALRHAYAQSRVLALPSVWPEPFGMAGAEALAQGIPVVASDVGGVRAWHDEGRGALLPPADPIALATALGGYLDDASAADDAGSRGRAFVSRELSLERHLARVTPLLEGR